MTRCTPAFTVVLLLVTFASNAVLAFVRPPLSTCPPPFLPSLHATEPTRDIFTASLFEDTAADPLRQDGYWEQLFMKGSSVAAPAEASPVSLYKESTMPALEVEGVEVVSFDLDDTLWCGKTVISNANNALQSFLQTNYPAMVAEGQPAVSSLMWLLAKKHPDEFLEDPEDPNSVVRFTDLRKLALSVLAQKCELPEPQAVAEAAFQAWHDARHDVDALLFPGAVELLQMLKGRGVRLCAVTNGNCDIDRIAAFEGIFEFCINAEKVGARKRTGRPYAAAVKKAGVGEGVGGRWVHIGDDFTEDIVAAKNDLKLRTIWYHTAERKAKVEKEQQEAKRERAKQQEEQKEKKVGSPSSLKEALPPGLSPLASMATASADRFFKDKGAVHVSNMDTDDYLTYSIVKEFADAEVETLEEVGRVIEGWLSQGGGGGGGQGQGVVKDFEEAAEAAVSALEGMGVEEDGREGGKKDGAEAETTKFCIACRAVLPARAKFCSTCGEAQS